MVSAKNVKMLRVSKTVLIHSFSFLISHLKTVNFFFYFSSRNMILVEKRIIFNEIPTKGDTNEKRNKNKIEEHEMKICEKKN